MQLVPSRKRKMGRRRPGLATNQIQATVAYGANDRQRNLVMPGRRPSPSGLVISIEETAGQAEPVILLFDANAFQTNKTGYVQPGTVNITGVTAPYDSIVQSTIANPFKITGINYEVSDSQYFNINFILNDLSGASNTVPIIPSLYRRNTQFQQDLLTLLNGSVLDGTTAVQIQLSANQLVTLSLFVKAVFNRLT